MLVHTKGRARAFAHATSGTVSIMFAVMSVVMLGTAALAIDYNAWTNQQSEMQSIGDAAALVGAKQLAVTGVSAEAQSASETFLTAKNAAAGTFLVTVVKDTGIVSVRQTALGNIYLAGTLGVKNPNIQVFSEATAAKPARPCIIALEPTASVGIDFSLAGSVTAIDCAIWSNSTSATSFDVNGSGTGSSSQNCAVGGVSGSSFAITPSVQAGCHAAADPYANWDSPTSSTCDYTDLDKLSAGAVTLTPGVYCGGLKVGGTSVVTLEPGIYIFKDGPLKVNAGASLIGNGVTIILTGANSSADFLGHASLHLSAPTSGPTEGMVIAAGRGANLGFKGRRRRRIRHRGHRIFANARPFLRRQLRKCHAIVVFHAHRADDHVPRRLDGHRSRRSGNIDCAHEISRRSRQCPFNSLTARRALKRLGIDSPP